MSGYNVYDYRAETDDNGYLQYDSPDEFDICSLFYDVEKGKFIDTDGWIIWDIFNYITPNDLYLFRKKKESMVVPYRTAPGWIVELFYPDDEDDLEYALAAVEGGWSPRLIYSKESQEP